MKIGVIQASSQASKNRLLYETVKKYAHVGAEVINFGCTPEEQDRYSYVEISVLIGEGYTWNGVENLEKTIEALFSEPFGQGYPKSEASRKRKDTELLKMIRQKSQIDMQELLEKLDPTFKGSVLRKKNVMDFIQSPN